MPASIQRLVALMHSEVSHVSPYGSSEHDPDNLRITVRPGYRVIS